MGSDKKRKRQSNGLSVAPIEVSHAPAASYPPIVATARGIAIPPLAFTPYTSPAEPTKTNKRPRPHYHLQGNNGRIEYTGTTPATTPEAHYIGIFDPATNSLTLHPAPTVSLSSKIVATKAHDAELITKGAGQLTYDEKRTVLGKAFGTRKAQAALLSREINKVSVDDMEDGMRKAIEQRVKEEMKGIPTTEMLSAALVNERPLPKYNKEAGSSKDVYDRKDLIEDEVWENVWVSDWLKAGAVQTKSSYVNNRAHVFLSAPNPKVHSTKLKLLKYISWLVEFYQHSSATRGRIGAPSRAKHVLYNCSQDIIDSFYRKFAEATVDPNARETDMGASAKKSAEKYTVSPRLETKIMYWIAILALMVDEFDVDLFDLKHDLNVLPKDLALTFREVGCVVREMTKVQTAAATMTKAESSQHKRAVLKVPLEFPAAPRKRGAARGRR
ncbi:RNA polymerase I associated factor, A49-like protein [Ascodesmis nigricans]|uniref:RNA polymerase I associated factor, A49-like protein n=1 Tax=Ascodesmis nigricans TaxID=341454 RepID=A0A4S2N5I0_9PEZI|nr:RNA polymerase I associated factor, A49-like protein [Ascodesmis nigricans]